MIPDKQTTSLRGVSFVVDDGTGGLSFMFIAHSEAEAADIHALVVSEMAEEVKRKGQSHTEPFVPSLSTYTIGGERATFFVDDIVTVQVRMIVDTPHNIGPLALTGQRDPGDENDSPTLQ